MAFTRAALEFLRDLEANNEREWFQPRKETYESLLRAPMAALVSQLHRDVPPEYAIDPAKAIYRIYRDTRFSPDKTPYKTHIGALLWHRKLGKNGGASFYFHVSTAELLVAGGLYKAPPELMNPVRRHISESHERLEAIAAQKDVKRLFGGLSGDRLARPPKGFTANHPAVEYLRFKDLLLETSLPADAALEPSAAREIGRRFAAMGPLLEYLNEPLLSRPRDPLF